MSESPSNGVRGWRELRERIPGRPVKATLVNWVRDGLWPAPMKASANGICWWSEEMIAEGLDRLRRRGQEFYRQKGAGY